MRKISVVVPVYHNESSLSLLHQRLADVAANAPQAEFEFVFVDDGSADNSFGVLKEIAIRDTRVKVLRLVRNFGSNAAILAGLAYAQGSCAIAISADLQDPPELIPEMIAKWTEGSKVVLAVRAERHDSLATRLTANVFNRLFKHFVFPNFPPNGFDFFLADREVVRVLVKNAGANLYLFGLLLWTGYKLVTVTYTRAERSFGKSQWTHWKKVKYFLDAFIGFSYLPLRLTSITGITLAILGFFYATFVVLARVVWNFPVEGWTSLMVVLLVVSGMQMIMLGILGEYLWRNLDETRQRSLFIIAESIGIDADPR